jgi:hypothetical protein
VEEEVEGVQLSGAQRICGLKRDEIKGDLRKFHIEELHDLYS